MVKARFSISTSAETSSAVAGRIWVTIASCRYGFGSQENNSVLTFESAARGFLANHRLAWRSPKHAHEWETTLRRYAFPVLANRSTADIQMADVLVVLQPLWADHPVTASRLRGRVAMVLSFAAAVEGQPQANPASCGCASGGVLPPVGRVHSIDHLAARRGAACRLSSPCLISPASSTGRSCGRSSQLADAARR